MARRQSAERVPLTGGAYQSRALIASAQRCINLFPEIAPPDSQAPVPVTHFETAGLTRLATAANIQGYRCLYTSTDGQLFAVVGAVVYYVAPDWSFAVVGAIPDGTSPVVMSDNGLVILVVDGTLNNGWAIDLIAHTFGAVSPVAFYGGFRVDCIDTFFLLNRPGTAQYYISLSNVTYAMLIGGTAFDALDIAQKAIGADPVATLIALRRELWLIGTQTGEVEVDTGDPLFAFAPLAGTSIEHGCGATFSVAKEDISVFWLSQDKRGKGIVVKTDGYGVARISTYAIETDIQAYPRIDDAIGFCYQLGGHAFYVLTFPTADKTWVYELNTGQWHEWNSIDGDGVLHRHRSNCFTAAYGTSLVGDYQNGKLYRLDPNVLTDDGTPIPRIRTFPHLIDTGNRVSYEEFVADMEVGQMPGTVDGPFSQSIQAIIQAQSLTGNLKLLLEAGNLPSWGGSGQKWLDESGGGYDFFLGTDGTVAADDPTFNGVLGGQSLSEYWSSDGADFFTYDSANEAWMNNIHKDGAKFTIAVLWFSIGSTLEFLAADQGGSGTNVGFSFIVNASNAVVFRVGNGIGNPLFVTVGDIGALPGWHFTAVSIDENGGTGAGLIYDNGVVISSFNPAYASPSAAAAAASIQLGAIGNGSFPMPAGMRMGATIMWEGVALTQAQLDALYAVIGNNNTLPSPLLGPPQISLRWSDTRGASYGNAVMQSLGASGQLYTQPIWRRLGLARDRVFELAWSAPAKTALNGAFVKARPLGT